MENLRKYGNSPFNVVLVHGGPGAAGEMAPVAKKLSVDFGVLEPLQTAITLDGQVEELKAVIEENGDIPVFLIGFSWGAWLSFILASKYPKLVKKLILISSGPFEEKYSLNITKTRLDRLAKEERAEVSSLINYLEDPLIKEKDAYMARFGKLISKADSCNPLPKEDGLIECRYDIYRNVWREASELRRSGKLLELGLGLKIQCPVVAIHGDYDPHPIDGVKNPLSRVLKNFRMMVIETCGHTPWIEKYAKNKFYKILNNELTAL